ncbi:MAG: SBBP repeat-containing protein [Chloroflexota bacterium]
MTSHHPFHRTKVLLLALTFFATALHPIPPAAASTVMTSPASAVDRTASLEQDYGKLPLSFIPNVGETDSAVRFQVRSGAGTLFFTPGEVVLSLSSQKQHSSPVEKIAVLADPPSVVRLRFEGANPTPTITGTELLPGIVNEFIGNDPTQWHSNIPTYAGVVYKDLYPGIDLRYDGHTGLLKGTYTVAPHADPTLIRWQYGGASGAHIDSASGDLLIELPNGKTLTEQAPIVWQQYAGQHIPVDVHYTQSDTGEIHFTVGDYDVDLPLVIDPTLVYSTYLGSSGDDYGQGIAVDSSGSAYVVGETTSINFPVDNAFQPTFGGGDGVFGDAFVTKMNPAGTALVYSTYLGGGGNDKGNGITVDSSGNAYVAGVAGSANFPITANAFQSTLGGPYDAFVTKMNPAGTALIYSTYLGGTSADGGHSIMVDSSGSAYVTGDTGSTNFPFTANAFQATYGGGNNDAFVTKLNPAGTALVYSTYLGGSSVDFGYSVAVDSSGSAYVAGDTGSTNFPFTANAFQSTFGGNNDAFVTKLNSVGTALVYSTYLGGGSYEASFGMTLDSSGSVYVTGYTYSTNFPITANAFQSTFEGGPYDAFVTKLSPSGTALVYSTYLGGSSFDSGNGLAVDSSGNAYVTGVTGSANFPTANAFQLIGGSFVTKLSPSGTTLVYSTYLGGSSGEVGYAVAVDSSGSVYLTGSTYSTNFPITANAFQSTYGGGSDDAFVTKFNLFLTPPLITSTDHATFTVGSVGTFTVTATGNPAPTFSATGLPAWATLNPTTGVLSGTPLNSVGSPFAVTITATNGVLPNATQNFTLTVGAGPLDTIGIFRPSAARFYLRNSNTTGPADLTTVFGSSTDLPVVGDWNGDGIDTVGIYRSSTGQFFLRDSNAASALTVYSFVLGAPGDLPMSGDWNNDGKDGVGVFRPSNGLIYLKSNLTTGFADFQMVLGVPGDVPVAGDWNGDGKDSPGVYRPSLTKFFLSNQVCNCSVFADYSAALGVSGDSPFAGDWNGDGISGIGVFRPSNGLIYLKNMPSSGFADLSLVFGVANDKPVAGHWATLSSSPTLAPTFVP